MEKQQWIDSHVSDLKKSKRLSSNGKIILDLHNRSDKTSIQEKMLSSILDSEYKAYLAKLDFEKAKKNANDKAKLALEAIKRSQLAENKKNRKKREHELITIGALTDTVGFEKDRGLVAGALIYVLEKMQNNDAFKLEIKEKGDALLHERELQKKSGSI
jgi:hypothetical protein